MAVAKKIINFLEKNKVKYEIVEHKTVYTAFDKAKTLKVKPNIIAKTLVLKGNGELIISAIPANKNLDKNKFKKLFNKWLKKQGRKSVKSIDFISERLMKNKLKGAKVGAVPPLGDLWKLPTFIDRALMKEKKIILNGGDYTCSLKISPRELQKLIPNLEIGVFSKIKK